MSKLHSRIAAVGSNMSAAMGDYHPWGTPDTPQVSIAHAITYTDAGGSVERLSPMITANGAVVPGRPPGRYGHVAQAGRP